jgi:hypothetical protein
MISSRRSGTQRGFVHNELYFALVFFGTLAGLFLMGVTYGRAQADSSLSPTVWGIFAVAAPLGLIGISSLVIAAIIGRRPEVTFGDAFQGTALSGMVILVMLFVLGWFVYGVINLGQWAFS